METEGSCTPCGVESLLWNARSQWYLELPHTRNRPDVINESMLGKNRRVIYNCLNLLRSGLVQHPDAGHGSKWHGRRPRLCLLLIWSVIFHRQGVESCLSQLVLGVERPTKSTNFLSRAVLCQLHFHMTGQLRHLQLSS